MTRSGANGNAGRVLVVEDDEGIREMLKYNLVTAGFSVHEASDGATGLRTARTARPDLILLDLMLPGMSGFIAEFVVFIGSFGTWQAYTVLGTFAIVITAGYILWMIRRVFFGPFNLHWEHLTDVGGIELVPLVTLIALILVVGLFPQVLTNVINSGISPLVPHGVAGVNIATASLGRLP